MNKRLLYYSVGAMTGTIGSHYIGEPLIGFTIATIIMIISIFLKKGTDASVEEAE